MKRALGLVAFALWAAPAAHGAAPCPNAQTAPWCDSSQSADVRAARLVSAMTLDEKLAMLAGTAADGHTGATAAIPRLGVPKSYNTDGPVGVRQGAATALPAPIAEAATFDVLMARLHGETIGNEARAKGNDIVLAPTVNMMRTPQNGRTFESFGEDPFLVSRIGVGWIEGAQSQGVMATVKHYAANNQEGSDPTGLLSSARLPLGLGMDNPRYLQNSVVDERTLREVYLPQFEAAVKEAGVGAVMCSYNRVNGDWACANRHLLQEVLIREWGFKGIVMSDWIFATHTWETAKHLLNGMDVEMPLANAYLPLLVRTALATGAVSRGVVDEHVRRILRSLFAFGFFDRAAYRNDDTQIDWGKHAAASQRIAESSITLLRNRDRLLPLDASKLKSIAVLGPQATKFVTGGGSGNVNPPATISALNGIKARAGEGVAVSYEDGSDLGRAAAAAKAADVAIVVAGDYQTEGADKSCLTLSCPDPGVDQDALIAAVAAAQPRTVVVLETGGPVLTPWRDSVGALVEAWYPGDHGGAAVARVLFGDVDPGGRLPVTFPRRASDEQVAGDRAKYPGTIAQDTFYKEGIFNGYRWFDARGIEPAFEFGAGMSYTTFGFGKLAVRAVDGGGAVADITAVNTGSRAGVVVPQLYLAVPPGDGVPQPPLKLAAFGKASVAPGAKHRFKLRIAPRALQHWDVEERTWATTPGCYGVVVGYSSRVVARRVTVAVGGASCPNAVASLPGTTCTRTLSVRRLGVRARSVRRVEVYVNGKRRHVLRGARSSLRVRLTDLPAGRSRVTVVVRRTGGAAKRIRRSVRGCG
ncbi:MAG TPA: glycoside hydrolase family 3 C-terminal domain-containing protein [Solirubrobacteraceae bacterium]